MKRTTNVHEMSASEFAELLDNVTRGYGSDGWWRASCPSPKHDRGNVAKPALVFRDGDDDALALKCHAGCSRDEVILAVAKRRSKPKPTEVDVDDARGDANDTEKKDSAPLGPIVAEYLYKDSAGAVVCRRTRHDPKDFRWSTPDGRDGWKPGLGGVRPPLYLLPEIQGAKDVIVVEGEKDAERALRDLKIAATTSGATGSWEPEHAEQLKDAGVERAWVIPDDDDPGMDHAQSVVASCVGVGIDARIVKIVDPEEQKRLAKERKPLKDLSDWLDAGHTKEQLIELMAFAPRELPSIDAGEQDLRVISEKTWDAVAQANGEDPKLFRFGNRLATLQRQEDSPPAIETVDEKQLRHLLARMANWYKETAQGTKMTMPPRHVIDDMFARASLERDVPVPPLLRIIETPVFGRDGRFDQSAGYQPVGRVYHEPPDGFEIPPVPEKPKDKDVERAKDLLFARKDSLLGAFPFKEEASLANAVACMIEPFVRDVFRSPSPFYMIKKPTTGTGATYLAQALMIPFLGKVVGLMSECKDEDERRKRLTAKLRTLEPAILIDNINQRIGNGHLCGAVTSGVWEDRLLGETRMLKIPVNTTWIGTANNPTMTTEMLSRTVWIRLDARMDEVKLRSRRWARPDLHGWALSERPRLVLACAVLVRRWFADGEPSWEGSTRFSRWGQVLGGILSSAGVRGFLANHDEERDAVADEHAAMRHFVTKVWAPRYGEGEVTASDLVELMASHSYEGLAEGADHLARTVSFGKRLKTYRDNVFGDWAITLGRKRHNKQYYRLAKDPEAAVNRTIEEEEAI